MTATEKHTKTAQPPRVVDVIEPPTRWGFPDLAGIWRQRELLFLLARRDLAVRYKQTLAGVAWVVIQPLAYAAVYSLALTFLRASPSDDVAYPVFVLTGLTLWLSFSSIVSRCSTSLVASSSLISRMHFPRIILPIAALLPNLVDFAVAFVVLIGVMLVYGVTPDVQILFAPLFVLLMVAVGAGIGLWFAAIAVRYRDIQQLVPFVLRIALYSSPVLYGLSLVPEAAQPFMSLNPATGFLEGFRWAVLPGTPAPSLDLILIPLVTAVVLLVTGLLYFRRAEDAFADVI